MVKLKGILARCVHTHIRTGHVEIIYGTDEPTTNIVENLERLNSDEEEEEEEGRYHLYLMIYTILTFTVLALLTIDH